MGVTPPLISTSPLAPPATLTKRNISPSQTSSGQRPPGQIRSLPLERGRLFPKLAIVLLDDRPPRIVRNRLKVYMDHPDLLHIDVRREHAE